MKQKVLLSCLAMFLAAALMAQTPEKTSFQAVLRSNTGALLANQNLQLRLTIQQGATTVYQEIHVVNTNAYGQLSVKIGDGVAVTGTYAAIPWESGGMSLQVEANTGSGYVTMGTEEIAATPYAQYAERAASADNVSLTLTQLTDVNAAAPIAGQMLTYDGINWVPSSIQPGTGIAIAPGNIITNTGDVNAADDITISTPASGDLSGTYGTPTVAKINGVPVSGAPANGQVLTYNGTNWTPTTPAAPVQAGTGISIGPGNTITNTGDVNAADDITLTTPAAGDLSGTFGTPTVAKINGVPVSGVPSNGQVLTYNGIDWAPATPTPPAPPASIVSVFSSGSGNNPATTTDFIGPTVSVTTTVANQKVYVNVSKALGSTSATGANSLNIYVGYRLSSAVGAPTTVGGGVFGIRVAQNQRIPVAINGVLTIPSPGTYNVGMVGSSTDATNWNNNEWGYITALVFP